MSFLNYPFSALPPFEELESHPIFGESWGTFAIEDVTHRIGTALPFALKDS